MNLLNTYAYWKDSGPTSESDFKTVTSPECGGAAKAMAKRAANTMKNFILIFVYVLDIERLLIKLMSETV